MKPLLEKLKTSSVWPDQQAVTLYIALILGCDEQGRYLAREGKLGSDTGLNPSDGNCGLSRLREANLVKWKNEGGGLIVITILGYKKEAQKRKKHEYTPEFEKWWEVNGLKKINKPGAFKKWRNAGDLLSIEIMIEHTKMYVCHRKEKKQEICLPEFFLSKKYYLEPWESASYRPAQKEVKTSHVVNMEIVGVCIAFIDRLLKEANEEGMEDHFVKANRMAVARTVEGDTTDVMNDLLDAGLPYRNLTEGEKAEINKHCKEIGYGN